MTVFNDEKFVMRSLKSLINQSFKKWEAIIIDDYSTDNTANLIKKFKDKRIKYFKPKKHLGRTPALNVGLKYCNGKYISILDADDFYYKDKLKKQVRLLEDNKSIKFLASWANIIDSRGNKISILKTPVSNDRIKKELYTTNIISHSSVIYDRDFAKKNKLIPYKLKYAQDYLTTLKFLKITDIYVIPKPLVAITWRNNSMTTSKQYRITVVKDELKALAYVKKNFTLDFKEKVEFTLRKLKLFFKLTLVLARII